jgi:hypothetical protein
MSTDPDDFAAGVAPLVLAHPVFGRCRAAGSLGRFKLTPCLPLDEVPLTDRSDADRNMRLERLRDPGLAELPGGLRLLWRKTGCFFGL